MSTGEWQEAEEPEIGARAMALCRGVAFDPNFPDSPYTLRGLLSVFRPVGEFPLVWHESVYLYVEYFGEGGDYEIWFDLIRFVTDEAGEITDEIEDACYGPFLVALTPGLFVQGRSYPLRVLPFQAAGLHELRLRVAGIYDPLAAIRFQVEV